MDKDDFWNDREVMSEEEAASLVEGQDYEEIEEESDPTDFMEVYEDEYEDMDDEELQTKADEVLDDALIRLEQGKLYNMIMETIDGGMFVESGCDERSINNVEREMKAFIMSRLEVLLGIRKKKVRKVRINQPQRNQSGLDEQEVAIIKKIVGNAAKKAGIPQTSIKKVGTIKAVVGNTRPVQKAPAPKTSPALPPKPAAKDKKKTAKGKKRKAPTDERKPLTKSPYQMSPEELMEYNKHIKSNSKTTGKQMIDPANPPIAQPTGDQMEQYHQQGGNVSSSQATTISTILNLMKQQGE